MQDYSELIHWVAQAKAGSEEAFAHIYNFTYSMVYNIACVSAGDQEKAKDIVSEVYIRVFKNLDQLRDNHRFVHWLIVITRHVCVDHKQEEPSEKESLLFLSDGSADDIEEWHLQEAVQTVVQKILGQLPEAQQRAVHYVYFRQLSLGQAAALENCSIGTIKSRLYYARETLRKAIDAEEKRSGDKLHIPVAAAALAGLVMLPQMPFSLSAEDAAQIFSAVMGALQLQYAADTDAPRIIRIENEEKTSFFRKAYLLRFTPAVAAAAITVITAAVLCMGMISSRAVPAQMSGDAGSSTPPEPQQNSARMIVSDTTESTAAVTSAAQAGTEVEFTTAHGAVITAVITEKGTMTVRRAQCEVENLIIPDEIDGIPVTEVAEGAFDTGCESVKNLHLHANMQNISGKTVASLSNLQAIHVPTSSPYLSSAGEILYNKDCSVLIAYPNDRRTSSFSVPDSVRTVSAYAINSRWLTKLTFPQYGVTTLEEYSLAGCVKLTEVRIPNTVSKIGDYALASPSLTYIYAFAGNEKNNWSWGGALLNYDKTHFVQYPGGKPEESYTVPPPILTVGAYAFSNADNLREIIIPATVTQLHANAFTGCDNLERIWFRGNVPDIVGGDTLILSAKTCRIEYAVSNES